ncbi:ubiquitin carboxyl-terminal hydrolase family protein [Stylonychia lemnae]|uniref:Ubiquitin carboxyl-terminal hydrolase family protein n=1 Tax=Stylonychia lemnae TaxID=5949 RepID=A0A078AXW2_STYLE|nr:ubiquitin carboxyl-terminal hydrolase family protein [Stylonychia lemnae]|eukprot:CDW85633.1 ubiquitin carboxyl-terminal hydrolase family protein [Stylonychia lemnae]
MLPQVEVKITTDSSGIERVAVQSQEKNYKQIQQTYESYEQTLKQGKNHTYSFKLQKKITNIYHNAESNLQIQVTQFVNVWLKYRGNENDLVTRLVGIQKDLEILEMIFDDNLDYYNYRFSKNTSEIEESLNRIQEQMLNQEIDLNHQVQLDFEVAYVKRQSCTSYYYVHNINMFSKYGGFQQILKLCQPYEKSENQKQRPQMKIFAITLNILTSMRQNFREQFWLSFAPQIRDLSYDFIINRSTYEDLRTATKKDLQYFINQIESMLDSINLKIKERVENVFQYSENMELNIALKCLQMPVLEKKLIGHTILINKIFQVKNQQAPSTGTQANGMNLNLNQRWLTPEKLIEWMDEQKIFDLVFGDSLHSEVIKKSYSLLQFLYQNNRIRQKELDKMWDCATKKHEAYKVAIMKAFAFLATKASLQDLQYIFNKLRSIQLNEIDKFSLGLIKSIAKKLAGEEDKSFLPQNTAQGRSSGLGRSNSFSKGQGSKLDDMRMNHSQPRTTQDDCMINIGKKDSDKKKNNQDAILDGWPKDDMSSQMITQGKSKQKKTRSLSGDDDGGKKVEIFQNLKNFNDNSNFNRNKNYNSQSNNNNATTIQRQSNRGSPGTQNQERIPELEVNPLEVPPDKEDKKTADEEGSFGERDDIAQNEANDVLEDIFDYNNNRDFQLRQNQAENNNRMQSDQQEEKGDQIITSNQEQIRINVRLMITDQSLGIDNQEKRDLAHQVLEYIWRLCLEETIIDNHVSLQIHKMSIDCFVEVISQNYPKALLPYIGKCIACLHHNYSVMSVQTLMHRLIQKISFPLDGKKLVPKNRQELLLHLDEELNIANVCLSSYIEFKRVSLSLIFDQLGSQEQEQENLETQSSLDNDDEKSSMQSAQKNNNNTNNNSNQQNNIHIQDFSNPPQENIQLQGFDDTNTHQSSGSLFISPRGKIEEEFKMPQTQKTQSYQNDAIFTGGQSFSRQHDFSSMAADQNEDWFTKNQNQQMNIGQTGSQTVGNRHFSTQQKKNTQINNQLRNDNQIQQQNMIQQQNPSLRDNRDSNEIQQNQAPQTSMNNSNRDFLNTLITNEVYKYSYYQDMQHRLDFLKFYIGSCPQILKPQQIQIVWECLVINAFYEKERDQFFNWCTQILKSAQSLTSYKDLDTLGSSSIFNDDCLEMLFFDTLLKLDFRYITETMYECFERFMIYINEQYGQIITNSAFESAFEVFETKLIGVEALWEITLCARSNRVYEKSAEFLHKLYKKMSPTLVERLNEIKEDLLQICMDQIKTGLNEIRNEVGNDIYDIPIYQFSQSLEDPKNRIARSISQLCKFIDEFEGLRERGAKSSLASQDKDMNVICNNQINSSQGPKKIFLTVPLSTKIGEIRDQVANAIFPKRTSKEICLTFKGKDQNEDLKTLKDLGVKADDQQATFFVTLRNQYELDAQERIDDYFSQDMVDSLVQQLRDFGLDLPQPVMQLAVKKCNLQLDDALLMLTEEDKVNDLQEELRKQEQLNNQIVILEENKEEGDVQKEDAKLNLILSNRTEYFELLFDLLNLGINEITNASWNLLIQIPVNKQLMSNIRNLSIVQQGYSENWCHIIDSSNVYKMLYSLQIVNSFISVNNEKLSEAEIQERYEWRERFLDLGGFDHLYSILITMDLDDLFGDASNLFQQRQMVSGSTSKKKQKGQQQKQKQSQTEQSNQEKKQMQMIQNNSAKCLGYLISIIKIFIQAALLTADEEKLLTLIVQSSTSPFRKPKTIKSALSSVPPNKFNQILFNAGSGSAAGSVKDFSINDGLSRDNSSVNTPKFHSNHSSNNTTPQCNTPIEPQNEKNPQINKSVDTNKFDIYSQQTFTKPNNDNQLYIQVDDFPRLVDQMSNGIAKNLLEKVINFNDLISKLLYLIHKSTQFSDSNEASSLVQNCLDLLLPCVVWKPNQLLKEIYEFHHLESLLIRTLMYSSNEQVRKSLERTFKIICSEKIIQGQSKNQESQSSGEQLDVESPKIYILRILLNNMPEINQKSDSCEEYFNLLTQLISQCKHNFIINPKNESNSYQDQNKLKQQIILDGKNFSSNALLEWCINQLKIRPTYEDKYSNYTDKILAGYLQLTQSVLEIDASLKNLTTNEDDGFNLVKTIFDFLFLLPSEEDQQIKHHKSDSISANDYPKCKRKFTRKKAFNLLLTLCHQCKPNYVQLLEELYKFHAQIQKSQQVVNLQDIDLDQGMRSAAGYVGLMNFAATCYMNSLIQQLFMIPDLRKGVLKSQIQDENLEQNVLHQLKLIFANLQESEKQYYAPHGFTKAFQFYGEPVNVRVQQDTHEFYNILCENIEESFKGTSSNNLLKETIGGVIGNETKSLESEYPYIGEREENFFAISLDIKNKKNLAEALDLYIKPDYLEGDNKYLCEKHNVKVNAQRRSYLKKLSNTVIINLKRFEFDYNTMMRQKVNDYCEFPTRINFKPWTKEGIKEREKELAKSQKNKAQSDNGNQQFDKEEIVLDQEEEKKNEIEPNAAGEDIDDEDMNYDEDHSESGESEEEEKKGGEALDEGMESNEDDIDQNVNTGTYFDGGMEDIIDIAPDEEESQSNKLLLQQTNQNVKTNSQRKNKAISNKNSAQRQKRKRQQSKDDSYYEYELVGVLVHSGSAEGGHYYSFIRERGGNNRWLEFDDKNVREFDIKKLEVECFGGNHDQRASIQHQGGFIDDFNPADGKFFERSRNAYLLFYQRVQPTNNDEQNNQIIPGNINQPMRLINDIEEPIYKRIWEENGAFLKLKVFFDQEYFQFIREYVNIYNFDNVLYFSRDHSQSYKINKLKELYQQYQIEGEEITFDYKSQQRQIIQDFKQSDDCNIFADLDKIKRDPGLYTLKLATIISQDIITKVKDVQNFVQWMQLINHLFERHEVACVWFIKYMTENRKILEELLLENQQFEFDECCDFDVDVSSIKSRQLDKQLFSRASVIRFMDLLFNQLLDPVRVHWRRFDEYFQVISHFAQNGFSETKYLIEQKAIGKLIEFMMNNNHPFTSQIKFKMGDRGQEPDFQLVLEILGLLIRSCFTQGIQNVSEYSLISRFQNHQQHIPYPQEEAKYIFTNFFFNCRFLNKLSTINQGMVAIIEHLSWGDLDSSRFFINEITEYLRMVAFRANDEPQNLLEYLQKVLLLKDEFQEQRVRMALKFDGFSANQSMYGFIMQHQYDYPLFVITIIKFFGQLSLLDEVVLKILKAHSESYKDWVISFITQPIKGGRGYQDEQFNYRRQQDQSEIQRAVRIEPLMIIIQYQAIFDDLNAFNVQVQKELQELQATDSVQVNRQLINDSFDFGENKINYEFQDSDNQPAGGRNSVDPLNKAFDGKDDGIFNNDFDEVNINDEDDIMAQDLAFADPDGFQDQVKGSDFAKFLEDDDQN